MSTAPGWYDDGSGRQRYWDGEEWTAHFADSYAADAVAPGRSHRLRALWSAWSSRERWVAIGSAAGTVIGILGLIVPLAVADRAASVDTVGVDSQLGDENGPAAAGDALEPVEAGLSASAAGLATDAAAYVGWAVPVDAPWEELFALHICEVDSSWDFTARGEADTAAASAWIEQHGIQSPRQSFTATISNTAGSGTITISEIRPQGTLTPAPDRVWVTKRNAAASATAATCSIPGSRSASTRSQASATRRRSKAASSASSPTSRRSPATRSCSTWHPASTVRYT